MYKGIIIITYFLFLVTSCRKEYSCEKCRSALEVRCESIEVRGEFTKGTSLSSVETIKFETYLPQRGQFRLSTDTVNGVYFTDSITISSAGNFECILKGNGTPSEAGVFSFEIGSCNFEIIFQAPVPLPDTFFYEGIIDGIRYKEVASMGTQYEAVSTIGVIAGGTDTATFKGLIRPIQQPTPIGKTMFYIFHGWLNDYKTCANARFKSFFTPGGYLYGNSGNTTPQATTISNGIVIYWMDENGVLWHSDYSINQSGRYFMITSVEDFSIVPTYQIKVKANFACKLFDNNGNSKTLTNGKFYGLFGKL